MTDRMGEKGKIATRRCPTCGHHEVGFVDAEGVFRPLTPGQPVVLLEGDGAPSPAKDIEEGASEAPAPEPPMSEGDLIPWVPEPLRGNRALRLVFGVLLPQTAGIGPMSPLQYRSAYLEKLRRLVAREEAAALAVMLDCAFAAPYLATGTPEEIALGLWRELDEIRSPAEIVTSWLEGGEEDLLRCALAAVPGGEEREEKPLDDETLHGELASLELEAFLDLIA